MNDFKFNCPKCGQHILANASWIGRQLDCPSCDTRITIPAPKKPPKQRESAPATAAVAKTKPPAAALQPKPAPKSVEAGAAQAKAPKPAQPGAGVPAPGKPTPPGPTPRVTPPVKARKNEDTPAAKPMETKRPEVFVAPDAKAKPAGGSAPVSPQVETKKELKKDVPRVVIPGGAKPAPSGSEPRAETPSKSAKTEGGPTDVPPTAQKVGANKLPPAPAEKAEASPDAAEPPEQHRIAVLSAAVKLDIVRAVRQRIANESAWLPGLVGGTTAYAAKTEGGKPVLLEVKSPEATRFSLMGAFVLELHGQQVIATATGRKKFLDVEIPEAIREVVLEQLDDETRESAEDPLADKDLLAISHSQCLAVLDVMEEHYSQRMEQRRIEKAKKRLGNVRLTDLVKKLEKKARVLPEDVATALYHELAEVRRRLDRLESRSVREE